MPWNTGNFTRTNGEFTGATVWQQDAAKPVGIDADRHDTHDQDIADGIDQCLNKGGQNSPTANISWGGNKITNLAAGAGATDAINKGQADAAYIQVAGGSIVTADIPMAGFKLTGLGDGTANSDAANYGQLASNGIDAFGYSDGTSVVQQLRCSAVKTGTGVWTITWDNAGDGTGSGSSAIFVTTTNIGGSYYYDSAVSNTSSTISTITTRRNTLTTITPLDGIPFYWFRLRF